MGEQGPAGDHGVFTWVYAFDTQGKGVEIPADSSLVLDNPSDGFIWVHVNLADQRARSWLQKQAAIPEEAGRMLGDVAEHQHIEQANRLIWGTIFDFVLELEGVGDTVGHLRFALGERFLVTARRHPLQSADATRREIEAGRRIEAPVALLEAVVDRIIDTMAKTIGGHLETLNQIEDRILDDEMHDERLRLVPIRRITARLHRQLTSMRAIFHRFELRSFQQQPETVRIAAARLVQRIDSIYEELHATQDRARLLTEEMSAQIANETNRNLSVLTGVTMLMLPPTLITGMFGMNVKGLLFGDDELGFAYALLMCLVTSLAMYFLVRKLGIFR
jgi:zinc transporter